MSKKKTATNRDWFIERLFNRRLITATSSEAIAGYLGDNLPEHEFHKLIIQHIDEDIRDMRKLIDEELEDYKKGEVK